MAHVSRVLARLKVEPLGDLPTDAAVDQLLEEHGVAWRDGLLAPLVTLRLMLIQIAHGNCAIATLRHLSGIDFAPSSYCEARARLPVILLQSLLEWVRDAAAAHVAAATATAAHLARRILIVDGSTYSVPDTPELAAHFHLPQQTRAGVGWRIWVTLPGGGAIVERGAIYVVQDIVVRQPVALSDVERFSIEEEYRITANRPLPFRHVRGLVIVPVWVVVLPLVMLAVWSWRRRGEARGFGVA